VAFVETYDEAGSFGQKSIGEPPTISPAPAIRNAVLDATGVAFNRIPMLPQSVFEAFRQAGLLTVQGDLVLQDGGLQKGR